MWIWACVFPWGATAYATGKRSWWKPHKNSLLMSAIPAYVKTSLISSVGRAPDCTARDHRPRHSLITNQTFQITAKISALCQLMWLCPLTRALLFTKNICQIQYCNVSILISCRVFFLNRRDVFRNSSCCSWLRSWILNMACLHTLRNQTLSGLMTW